LRPIGAVERKGRADMGKRLEERLKSGDVVKSPSGVVGVVVTVAKPNEYGERLYRLRYRSGVVGRDKWTVTDMRAAGITYADR